jgi:hypothetical protein
VTPMQYAERYLPVRVPGPAQPVEVNIRRYRLGDPKPAKDALLGAVNGHLTTKQKKDPGYRLMLSVNGHPLAVANWREIAMSLLRPFIGKGSPEDCQIVLQAALLTGGIAANRLQTWADENLGLDCNGFVGNYIFYDVLKNDWRTNSGKSDPGANNLITTIFQWAAGPSEKNVIDDLSLINLNQSYLIARVDNTGRVMPGGPGNPIGHIAVTQPGEIMRQSFVYDSMGGLDLEFARLDMYNHFAMRTIESAGPTEGVSPYWMVFLHKSKKLKKVFEIRRDRIHKLDTVKIAPIP